MAGGSRGRARGGRRGPPLMMSSPRTAPGDLYLKGGGNFSNWLLRFFPDEEESDEASLNGGESLREEEDDGESGEREDEDEDEHAVGEEEGEHEVAEEEEAS